jgi:hypothetical protein
MFAGRDVCRRGKMRLACAVPADEDGVVSILQEVAAVKVVNEGIIDRKRPT